MRRIAERDLTHIMDQTETLWEQLRGKSIFLTGGTGFFGKWLLESFFYINNQLSLNADITLLTRDPENFLSEYPSYRLIDSLHLLKGDVQDFVFPSKQFHYIIHGATAADAALNQAKPLLMLDTIAVGTRRVLDLATQNPIKSFLFISSGAVYGKQPADVTHIKETDGFPIEINNPASAYAEGKRMAELYSSTYFHTHGVPVKIARCFAFVGPYLPLDKHFAIGNFIYNAIKGEDIIIKGDGTPYRSYLYAADLAIWLWTILLKGQNNTPYNVGSDEDLSIKEVADIIGRLHPSVAVKVLGKTDHCKPVERYVPNIDLAKRELGLKVYIDNVESIIKTIEFYEPIL